MSGRPPRSPGGAAERLGRILPRVLTELGLDERAPAVRLLGVWDEALGDELAPFCRPEGLRHGVLTARVPDSAWMQRLQLEKPRILERLRRLLETEVAEDLRFRIGPIDRPNAGGARETGGRSGPSG